MSFWGITCESGKRYSQVTRQAFRVSMAALEPKDIVPENKLVSLMLEHNGKEFLLCTLNYETVLQVNLDLQFGQGEELFFFINGEGTIHLSGYISEFMSADCSDSCDSLGRLQKSDGYYGYVEGQSFSDDEESGGIAQLLNLNDLSGDEDDDWNPSLFKTRRSRRQVSKQTGYEEEFLSLDEDIEEDSYDEEEDDDEDDEHNEEEDEEEEDDKEIEDNEGDKDELEDNECDKENEIEEVVDLDVAGPSTSSKKRKKFLMPEPVAKRPKQKRSDSDNMGLSASKKKNKATNGLDANVVDLDDELNSSIGHTPMPKKKVLFKERSSASEDTGSPALKMNNSATSAVKATPEQVLKEATEVYSTKLPSGVELQDIRVGNGPIAKKGKFVHVHYVGKLTSGKVFDSSKPGVDKPLSFRLGRSEVIPGWDHGIQGMRVGGRRKLKIPPPMAYGKKSNGPIPGNSTLLFTVELKAVN